jgi:tetratricopeptide (TPR) repeat protein
LDITTPSRITADLIVPRCHLQLTGLVELGDLTPKARDKFDTWDDAHIKAARKLIEKDPNIPLGHSAYGEVLYLRDQFDEAIPHLMKAAGMIAEDLESPHFKSQLRGVRSEYIRFAKSTLAMLGDCHLRLDNIQDAEEWFKKAVEMGEDIDFDFESRASEKEEGDRWARYAQTLGRCDKWEEAAHAIRQALEYEPSKPFYWELLSEIYSRSEKRMAPDIQAAIERNLAKKKPYSGKSFLKDLLLLADIAISAADYEAVKSAVFYFEETAWNYKYDESHCHMREAQVAHFKRDYSYAIKILEKILKEDATPESIINQFSLVRAYIFVGGWNRAEKLLAQIVQYALNDLNEKKAELLLSMTSNTPPPESKLVLESAVRYLHLLIDIRDHPTQRFRMLLYDEENDSFKLYPDVIVPSGTTAEDFLHWSKANFDDMFPANRKIFSSSIHENVRSSTDVIRPEELARSDPGEFSLIISGNTSYEEERGEDIPSAPGGAFPTKYVGIQDPILTGDTVTLLPWKLADNRFSLHSASVLGMLLSDVKESIKLREEILAEEYSENHIFGGARPYDRTELFEGRLALADYYISEGYLSVAAHHLHAAMESHPKEPAVFRKLLQLLYAKQDYEKAYEIAEKAAKAKPKDSAVWYYIGLIRERMGREHYKQAEKAYKQSVKTDKNDPLPRFYLAVFHINRGNAKEGMKWINEALKLEPDNLAFNVVKAEALRVKGEYEEAEKLARTCTSDNTDDSYAWVALANVLIATKNWEEAMSSLERALELDQENFHAFAAKGEIHLELRNLEEAEMNLRNAVEMEPTDGDFWYTLALTLEKLGKKKESAEAMRNAWKYGALKAEPVD